MTSQRSTIKVGKFKVLSTLLLIGFFVIFGFLFRWQIVDHDTFNSLAKERVKDNKFPAIRGDIVASDGSSLAYSEPTFHIIAYRDEFEFDEKRNKQTREEFVKKVAGALKMEENEIRDKLNQQGNWIYLKRDVKNEQKEAVLSLKTDKNPNASLAGIRTEYSSVRVYPEDALASHVVGFVGKNDIGENLGRAGVESYWEGALKAYEGSDFGEFDSFGNVIALDKVNSVEARRGATIHTTIDKNIQMKVERRINEAVEKYKAKSGTIIVMDPKTGAILALANSPGFNPNEYTKVEDANAFKNSAVTDPAELGSIGKLFTVAGAINENAIQPNSTVINGHSGCTIIKENERDWKVCTYDRKAKGAMNATQALVDSDNLALYEISKKIGQEKLHDYLEAFGIGEKTGIDISGESTGLLRDSSEWTKVDSATYSFGHGYQMTPLQAITGLAAVANDGKRMQPYLVSKMVEATGKEKEFSPRVVNEPITADTAKKLQAMTYEVYKSNLDESRYKSLAKYKIGMKSGTATIPFKDRAGYSKEINATYVGFDESDQKTFIMLVKLEEPTAVERLSYFSARIVWLDTFMDIKDDLGVPEVR